MAGSSEDEGRTSAGVLWSEVPEHARQDVEWIDGRHGQCSRPLPSIEEAPVPEALLRLPRLHPDRPRGSKAMIDAHGARARLGKARPGAWLVSPLTGHKWAIWPGGEVGWVPAAIELPHALRVDGRDDLQ